MKYEVDIAGRSYGVEVEREEREWRCRVDGEDVPIDAVLSGHDVLSLLAGGKSYEVKLERNGSELTIVLGGRPYAAEVRDPRSLRSRKRAPLSVDGPQSVVAPMPGKVVRVLAPENTKVRAGGGIVVIEAMKMQNELKSPKDGRIRKMLAKEGAAVNAGDVLAVVE